MRSALDAPNPTNTLCIPLQDTLSALGINVQLGIANIAISSATVQVTCCWLACAW